MCPDCKHLKDSITTEREGCWFPWWWSSLLLKSYRHTFILLVAYRSLLSGFLSAKWTINSISPIQRRSEPRSSALNPSIRTSTPSTSCWSGWTSLCCRTRSGSMSLPLKVRLGEVLALSAVIIYVGSSLHNSQCPIPLRPVLPRLWPNINILHFLVGCLITMFTWRGHTNNVLEQFLQ